jgi:hypothetical protein
VINYAADLTYLRTRSELVLLSDFYDKWLTFQQLASAQADCDRREAYAKKTVLASAKADRDQLEVAAQEIVDAHHKIQEWRATRQ